MKLSLKGFGMGMLVLALAACGDDDRSLSQRAGSAISGTAADFVAGVGEGVDKRMEIALAVDPSVAANGLAANLGKSRGVGSKDAAIYVTSTKAFEGKLLAKALDGEGVEVGRSVVEVAFEADDGKYVNFAFNQEMDSQTVRKYELSVR